jgi:hypothetical protein
MAVPSQDEGLAHVDAPSRARRHRRETNGLTLTSKSYSSSTSSSSPSSCVVFGGSECPLAAPSSAGVFAVFVALIGGLVDTVALPFAPDCSRGAVSAILSLVSACDFLLKVRVILYLRAPGRRRKR